MTDIPLEIILHQGEDAERGVPPHGRAVCDGGPEVDGLAYDPAWLRIFTRGLQQVAYLIEARSESGTVGHLPLMFVRSMLFGRFLVSLPYLNTGGVRAVNDQVAGALIGRAVELADELKVRYLELRHERAYAHEALNFQ